MKRNTTKKTDRKAVVTVRKNDKKRKGFRTGVKAGVSVGTW